MKNSKLLLIGFLALSLFTLSACEEENIELNTGDSEEQVESPIED